ILLEPVAVVKHEADKALLGTTSSIALRPAPGGKDTPHIAGEGESHFVEGLSRFVEILDLDTVIGVDAAALWYVQVVVAKTVIVGDDVHPGSRSPLDLSTQPLPRIGRGVRLPSIDEPRLDFQVGGGENLHSQSLEKPWRVGRNIRRLVGPIIKVVIAEEADVRHEDARVNVDPIQQIGRASWRER